MKNKTVEAMVRTQFNLPDDNTTVTVVFLVSEGGFYEFDVCWFVDEISFQLKVKLPFLEPRLTWLGGTPQ